MSIVGADASFSRQSGASLAKAGIRSIGRYAGPADPGKVITKAELDDYLAHGVSVWLVYEIDVNSWQGGYQVGKLHGQQTRTWARQTLSWPDDRPIYAAYDTAANAGDKTAFMAYQQGFNDGQGVSAPGAAYGDGFLLLTLRNGGLIKLTWLSDSSAFPGSQDFAKVGQPSIIQYYGRTVPGLSGIDVDECFGDDWGQHPAPRALPPVIPSTSEATVFLVQEHGSQTVHAIGAGPNGVTDLQAAHLNAWKAAIANATGKPAVIEPVEPGFCDNIRKGS